MCANSLQSCPTLCNPMDCCKACQASLSFTISQSLLKLMYVESIRPSNHLILCHSILLLPASGSFQMSQFFATGGRSIGFSASAPVLPMNIQDWFPLWWTGLISLQSKGLNKSFLQHHSLKASNFQYSGFFMVRVSHPYMTTGKTIALTIQTFVSESKVIETDICFFLLVPPLIFITLWGILSYPPFHRWRNRNSEIHLLKVLFPVKKSLN